jgi:hypothetical protein
MVVVFPSVSSATLAKRAREKSGVRVLILNWLLFFPLYYFPANSLNFGKQINIGQRFSEIPPNPPLEKGGKGGFLGGVWSWAKIVILVAAQPRCDLCSQPIMLRVLPVKVWLRQLTVWPDSHTRRFLGATPGSESSKVKALAGEEQATHRAVA